MKEYVDTRFDELDKRVKALNEARHHNMATVALIVSLLALFVAVADVTIWSLRQ